MWKYTTLEMEADLALIETFKKYSKIGGILFIILGIIGIVFPTFMTFTTVIFLAYLMLFAGLSSAWMTWMSNRKDWAGWLKSFLLMGVAVLMLSYPMEGVATLGLLFSIYFFTDAFASFGLAFSLKPQKIWWMWLFNAITSLVLGAIFIVEWPFGSLFMVGLLVGISLLFDGIALLTGGALLEAVEKEEKNHEDKA